MYVFQPHRTTLYNRGFRARFGHCCCNPFNLDYDGYTTGFQRLRIFEARWRTESFLKYNFVKNLLKPLLKKKLLTISLLIISFGPIIYNNLILFKIKKMNVTLNSTCDLNVQISWRKILLPWICEFVLLCLTCTLAKTITLKQSLTWSPLGPRRCYR